MALNELTTKISFNELITKLNENFGSLSDSDKELLRQIETVSKNKRIENLMKGDLALDNCLLDNVRIKIGQSAAGNSLNFNNNGVSLKIGNTEWSDHDTGTLVVRVNGGDEIDLTTNTSSIVDGRVFMFVLGELDENVLSGYNASVKYRGYGDNEDTTFILGVKQPSLILMCSKQTGTDNQTSFIRLTGTGNNDGSNVDQQISNIKSDIKDLQDKTRYSSNDLQTQISQNDGRINSIDGAIENLDSRVTNVEDNFNSLANTVLTTDNVNGNFDKRSDKIASVSYVTDIVSTNSNRYICSNAYGDAFETRADLDNASVFYYGSNEVTPVEHDVVLVLRDETHEDKCFKYVRSNDTWAIQYKVNDAPFTPEQNAAIDSGINSTIVGQLFTDDNITSKLGRGLTNESGKINSSVYVDDTYNAPYAKINNTNKKLALNDDLLDVIIDVGVNKTEVNGLKETVDDLELTIQSGLVTLDGDAQTISSEKTFTKQVVVQNNLQLKNSILGVANINVNDNNQLEIDAKSVNLQPEGKDPIIVSGINTPVNDTDAVNKKYVDERGTGIQIIQGNILYEPMSGGAWRSTGLDNITDGIYIINTPSNEKIQMIIDQIDGNLRQRIYDLPTSVISGQYNYNGKFDYLERVKTGNNWGKWTETTCCLGLETITIKMRYQNNKIVLEPVEGQINLDNLTSDGYYMLQRQPNGIYSSMFTMLLKTYHNGGIFNSVTQEIFNIPDNTEFDELNSSSVMSRTRNSGNGVWTEWIIENKSADVERIPDSFINNLFN